MWLASNQIISHKLSKWLKLIELSMVMVLGNVKNEKCFLTISITKAS
jgi:hypothetical protein